MTIFMILGNIPMKEDKTHFFVFCNDLANPTECFPTILLRTTIWSTRPREQTIITHTSFQHKAHWSY